MSRKEETPFILKWEENQKDPTQKEAKERSQLDAVLHSYNLGGYS
jgi:hypothetical protein